MLTTNEQGAINYTDCRSDEGITVGLIDGMIVMMRILAKRNLGYPVVQEALKDFIQDEDVKFVMNAVQDWDFDEESNLLDSAQPSPTNDLCDALRKQIDIIVAEGESWPNDAVYMTESRSHTWPMGWDKDTHKSYFPTQEALDEYLVSQRGWSMLENNEVKISIFEWDLGPNFKEQVHFS